jgi:UDP-N-acetylmuramate--alanine ligase
MTVIDLLKIHKMHFTGIRGIAMSSLAKIAQESGYEISGSDVSGLFPSDQVIEKLQIQVSNSFSAESINQIHPDLLIYTGAHGGSKNPEVIAARQLNIPAISHGQALGEFMKKYQQISVAGCHGKTSTGAMIATILAVAKQDPAYAIGCGEICPIGFPGATGHGKWFVAEADEYITDPGSDLSPRFLWQNPRILVITNIEYDHPDAYRNLVEIQAAYQKLADKLSPEGVIIINGDDYNSTVIKSKAQITKVGWSDGNDYQIKDAIFDIGKTTFTLKTQTGDNHSFTIQVPGKHSVINAAMAVVCAFKAGLSWSDIEMAIAKFCGTKRRFEKLSEKNNIVFYDDYAHHPSEIQATLSAARLWYPKHRIISVFQPHTYSRTKALLPEFASSFADSDIVIISEIYASARENETLGINGQIVAQKIAQKHDHVEFQSNETQIYTYLQHNLKSGDVIIFMGAGDIYNWGREIVVKLTQS